MANTYNQIYIQTVFAVKYRNAVIENEWKDQLCPDSKEIGNYNSKSDSILSIMPIPVKEISR